MKPLHLIFFAAFCCLTACSQDTRQVFPDEFRPYVEAFFEDARARGHNLHLEDYDLTISFRDLNTEERAAYCRNLNRHKIRFDETVWRGLKDQQKKRLMYHELGHCILDLRHRNVKSSTGLCYSIMSRIDELPCHRDIYSEYWWKYYVDELFDISLTPEAYQSARPLREIAPDDRLTLFDVQDTLVERQLYFEEIIPALPASNFTYEVTKTASEGGRPGFSIGIGGVKLQYCNCVLGTVSISNSVRTGGRTYYSTPEPFEEPVTLTIQREDELLYFYANGVYVHAVEAAAIDGDLPFFLSNKRRSGDTSPLSSLDVEIYAW